MPYILNGKPRVSICNTSRGSQPSYCMEYVGQGQYTSALCLRTLSACCVLQSAVAASSTPTILVLICAMSLIAPRRMAWVVMRVSTPAFNPTFFRALPSTAKVAAMEGPFSLAVSIVRAAQGAPIGQCDLRACWYAQGPPAPRCHEPARFEVQMP